MGQEGSAGADAKTSTTNGVPDSVGSGGDQDKHRGALYWNLSVIDGIATS
jgi:hypothetical protein